MLIKKIKLFFLVCGIFFCFLSVCFGVYFQFFQHEKNLEYLNVREIDVKCEPFSSSDLVSIRFESEFFRGRTTMGECILVDGLYEEFEVGFVKRFWVNDVYALKYRNESIFLFDDSVRFFKESSESNIQFGLVGLFFFALVFFKSLKE